jgi:hypothetical protein
MLKYKVQYLLSADKGGAYYTEQTSTYPSEHWNRIPEVTTIKPLGF